jgi:hypothetical protein
MDHGEVVAGCLLVSGRYAAVLLDAVEEELDLVPLLVELSIIGSRRMPVSARRYDRF